MPDSAMLQAALESFLAVVASLFAIINPFSVMPLFLTLTANMSDEKRSAYAARVSRNAAVIMLVTLFLGGLILEFFGISLSALRIAGGLIVAFLGFNLIFPSPRGIVPAKQTPGEEDDYSFMPLAFPSLTGAGTIAVIMSFSTKIAARPTLTEKIVGHAIVVAGIFALTVIIWALFRISTRLVGVLGAHGLEAMSRIMGLMLVCVGVELVGDGIKSFTQGA
jgi:multiple antibiotic resistance protein